jgi:hypothetical protein
MAASTDRMHEAQHGRVQRLSPQVMKRCRCLGWQPAGARSEVGAVGPIAEQRVADMREMDPDLVRPPRLEPALDEAANRLTGRVAEPLE